MSIPKMSAGQKMKAQAEGSMLMALMHCLEAIDAGNVVSARENARTVTRYSFMLNPKMRKRFEVAA